MNKWNYFSLYIWCRKCRRSNTLRKRLQKEKKYFFGCIQCQTPKELNLPKKYHDSIQESNSYFDMTIFNDGI